MRVILKTSLSHACTSVEVNPSPPGSPPEPCLPLPTRGRIWGPKEALNPGHIRASARASNLLRRERTVFKGSALGVAGLGLCCHDSIFLGPPRGCRGRFQRRKESTGQNHHYRIYVYTPEHLWAQVSTAPLTVPSPQFAHPGGRQACGHLPSLQSIHPRMTELPHGGLSLPPAVLDSVSLAFWQEVPTELSSYTSQSKFPERDSTTYMQIFL